MRFTSGTRLGHYEILDPVGAGGMGEVYRAHDPRLGRDVAIKVLRQDLADDPSSTARFEREARAVASLSHPNILAIHDVGNHEGAEYVVTELLDGETLRGRLAGSPLSLKNAVEVGTAICDGVAAAHGRNLVHRDLKPENIFLTSDDRVKILDFGLAVVSPLRSLGALSNAETITQAGAILGTDGYMSPEQVRGEEVKAPSDIFSLGCVLYEMLTGTRAFTGDTSIQTIYAILEKEPVPPSKVNEKLPPEFDRLLSSCLEKNPALRMQSARDLGLALADLPDRQQRVGVLPESSPHPDPHSEAQELFQRARYLMSTGTSDGDNQKSIELLKRATTLDPRFAPAQAALGRAYIERRMHVDPTEAGPLEQMGFAAVERALALDPDLAEAYVARGNLLWTKSHRFAHVRAIREHRRALELAPRLDSAHQYLASILAHLGFFEEALAHTEKALESNPGNGVAIHHLAEVFVWSGEDEKALPTIMTIPRAIFSELAEANVSWIHLRAGRMDDAASHLREAFSRYPEDSSGILAGMEVLLLAHSDPDAVDQRIKGVARATGLNPDHHTTHFLGCAMARLGRAAEAVSYLRETAENGFPCYPLMVSDPNLDPIRQDPAFMGYIEDLKKQYESLKADLYPDV
jgi:serine/threonine protein kinase